MSLDSLLDDLRERTVWSLARDANTYSPDDETSPGGDFLDTVRRTVIEAIESLDNPDTDDIRALIDDAHGWVDGTVPVYTYTVWRTFVDLGAFEEDIDDMGGPTEDMTRNAMTALYMIADRLFCGSVAEVADALDDEEEDEADEEESLWCEDCGARLDGKGLCPSCLPNSERNPDEVA